MTGMPDRSDSPYVVETEAVTRRFGPLEALRPTTLRIRTGEHLAIMGPSGCGKTTLLNLLGALDRPSSGKVVFSGRTLTYGDREVTERELQQAAADVPPRARHRGNCIDGACRLRPTGRALDGDADADG